MVDVLGEPDDVAVVYLNDTVLFQDNPDKLQDVAIQLVHKLTTAGFILNIKKLEFLISKVKCWASL